MRRHNAIWTAALATVIVGSASAMAQQPPPRPCAAIRAVCLQAGFVPNGVREGDGLAVDCIRPIMQGIAQPARATKPLPAVDPQLVEACRAQNPNFGMGNGNAARQGMQPPPQANQPSQMTQPPQDAPAGPPQAPQAPR